MSEITREAFNAACEAYKGERHMVDRGAMLSALEAFVASTQPKSIDRDSVLEEAAKACAQVIADSDKNMDHELGTGFDLGCEECANAIRSLKDAP